MKLNEIFVSLLETLEDTHDVVVNVGGDGEKTIYVYHDSVHSFKIKFVWSNDHYIGYSIDADENCGLAIVSVRDLGDAMKFVTSYGLLIELRAKRQ